MTRERGIQFRPCAIDVFGVYAAGATAILQHIARKRSEHSSMTTGMSKKADFQSSASHRWPRTRAWFDRGELYSPLFSPPSIFRISELVWKLAEKTG
jgi:hypothetical protein